MTAPRLQNYQDCSCVYNIILTQSREVVKRFCNSINVCAASLYYAAGGQLCADSLKHRRFYIAKFLEVYP